MYAYCLCLQLSTDYWLLDTWLHVTVNGSSSVSLFSTLSVAAHRLRVPASQDRVSVMVRLTILGILSKHSVQYTAWLSADTFRNLNKRWLDNPEGISRDSLYPNLSFGPRTMAMPSSGPSPHSLQTTHAWNIMGHTDQAAVCRTWWYLSTPTLIPSTGHTWAPHSGQNLSLALISASRAALSRLAGSHAGFTPENLPLLYCL